MKIAKHVSWIEPDGTEMCTTELHIEWWRAIILWIVFYVPMPSRLTACLLGIVIRSKEVRMLEDAGTIIDQDDTHDAN